MLLETESREVNTGTENLCLSKDTDTTDTVNFHLHVWVAIGITEVSQMWSPRSILCVSFDNNSIFVKCVSEGEGGFRLLPGVQVVGLLSTEPVR